jgi:hypothetical protein
VVEVVPGDFALVRSLAELLSVDSAVSRSVAEVIPVEFETLCSRSDRACPCSGSLPVNNRMSPPPLFSKKGVYGK